MAGEASTVHRPVPRRLPARATALLLALCAALLLFRLGQVPLVGPDEPRYARVAAEMGRRGDLVTPTLQGQPWLEKPALYYWMAAGAFAVFGETEAAARLPSVLATLLLVGATALFGARALGAPAGLHAGFVLGTSALAFAFGRGASMDMLLAACVTVSIALAGLRLLGIAGRGAMVAAWAFAALGTLAKGPLGLLLPALVALAYVAVTRDGRRLRELLAPAGPLVFLAIAGPWYAAILHEQGRSFVDVFLLDHHLARFVSTIHRHPGPPYYYLPVIVLAFVPWTGLLLPAFALLKARTRRADLFLLLWAAAPLAFFSVAGSKLPGYVLPCLPPLALLMGRAAAHVMDGGALPRGTGRLAIALTTAALGLGIVGISLRARQPGEPGLGLVLAIAGWIVAASLVFAARARQKPAVALGALRVAAAGLLAVAALAAPPLAEAVQSGRGLFAPTQGREVLVWGAWRTAWMAGYWYNDGRVREVSGLRDVSQPASAGPVLVLCGPEQRSALEAAPELRVRDLAHGPRGSVLLRVERMPDVSRATGPGPTATFLARPAS